MGVHHLCPRPPSLAASAATLHCSTLRSSAFRRPFPGLKTPRLRLAPRCAADQPCEPSPEEDEPDAWGRRHREEKEQDSKEIRAASRARCGGSSQEDMVAELKAKLFRTEEDKFHAYSKKIVCNNCILYKASGCRDLALGICTNVSVAIGLCATITAHAHLRVDGSDEISVHTVEQIIRTYVLTFVKFIEDVWNRNVDNDSRIFSFLGALSGLAAISHILLEDALAAVNTSEYSSSNYSPEYDVEALNHELQRKMADLERKFMAASKTSKSKAYEILKPTLYDATTHVSRFVTDMTKVRKKAIAHAQARAEKKMLKSGQDSTIDL
ncbi:hypothetical protein ACP70R_004935 [Stipagrostis hirtigluma subsp. patula]